MLTAVNVEHKNADTVRKVGKLGCLKGTDCLKIRKQSEWVKTADTISGDENARLRKWKTLGDISSVLL